MATNSEKTGPICGRCGESDRVAFKAGCESISTKMIGFDRPRVSQVIVIGCENCGAETTIKWEDNPMAAKRGIGPLIGKWPGDETDEEIDQALKEL